MKIDTSFLHYPQKGESSVELPKTCLISSINLEKAAKKHINSQRPYPLLLIRDKRGESQFFDAQTLMKYFTVSRKFLNPSSKEEVIELHFIFLKTLDGRQYEHEHCYSLQGITPLTQAYVLSCSLEKTEEVLDARKEFIKELLKNNRYLAAAGWLELTIKEFPRAVFGYLELGKLLQTGGHGLEKDEERAQALLAQAKEFQECVPSEQTSLLKDTFRAVIGVAKSILGVIGEKESLASLTTLVGTNN